MNKSRLIGALSAAVLSFITLPSQAALTYVLGGQAVYDDVADLSWTTNANINGLMNWTEANNWAASLDIDGVAGPDGWRLPTTLQPDASCSDGLDPGGGFGTQSYGTGCTGSEMGNLYNVEGVTAASPGLFSNVQSDDYWSSTEYAPSTGLAWEFGFGNGVQNVDDKGNVNYAWAVHSGNVGAVPNTPPIADAGDDQALLVLGTTVQLDGSQSIDPDEDPITYQWQLATPIASGAVLDIPTSPTPSFTADLYGDYVGTLTVTDDKDASSQDQVTISFQNIKPVADAGVNHAVLVGDTVMLDGGGSSDANMDALTFQWNIDTAPAGSVASVNNPTSEMASVVPDSPGAYIVSLVVNDGLLNSDPDTAEIVAINLPSVAAAKVMEAISVINTLDQSAFKNANVRDLLTSKLNKALADIEVGRYKQAIGTLEKNVLAKTDGCATSSTVENNDWIVTCEAQAQVYPLVMEAIQILERL